MPDLNAVKYTVEVQDRTLLVLMRVPLCAEALAGEQIGRLNTAIATATTLVAGMRDTIALELELGGVCAYCGVSAPTAEEQRGHRCA